MGGWVRGWKNDFGILGFLIFDLLTFKLQQDDRGTVQEHFDLHLQ